MRSKSVEDVLKGPLVRSPFVLCWLLGLIFCFGGCGHPSAYRAPVAKFRDASAVVIAATKSYLLELNKTERKMYINGQAANRKPIQLNKIEEVQGFSKEGIAVRLNALDQLANYTDLLNQLANSDAPDRIKAKAADLQTALTTLSGQINNLGGPDDTQFKTATGRVLPVIGDVLQAFAESRIEDGLHKAVTTGAPAVNQLIQAIETDVAVAFERKKSGFSGERVRLVDQYNLDLHSNPASLQADADAIAAEEDRWEAFLAADPKDGLEAMKRANDALVKFAGAPKRRITDLNSFVDAVESFAATANRVGQAVHELTGR